jgi:hypothetical protein
MKKSIYIFITALFVMLVSSGCSTKTQSELGVKVAKKEFINHFTSDVYTVYTSEDLQSVVVYLPKDTTTVRIKMKVANLEDVVYMKLVDESPFNIDKILRRVDDINKLGLEQDGYMFEPSVEKDIVTLQIYVPSIYLYDSKYQPKLVYAYKRDLRVLQDKVNFSFLRKKYSVVEKDSKEYPRYTNIKEYCKDNKISKEYFDQLDQVNTIRVDEEFIKELREQCIK